MKVTRGLHEFSEESVDKITAYFIWN